MDIRRSDSDQLRQSALRERNLAAALAACERMSGHDRSFFLSAQDDEPVAIITGLQAARSLNL